MSSPPASPPPPHTTTTTSTALPPISAPAYAHTPMDTSSATSPPPPRYPYSTLPHAHHHHHQHQHQHQQPMHTHTHPHHHYVHPSDLPPPPPPPPPPDPMHPTHMHLPHPHPHSHSHHPHHHPHTHVHHTAPPLHQHPHHHHHPSMPHPPPPPPPPPPHYYEDPLVKISRLEAQLDAARSEIERLRARLSDAEKERSKADTPKPQSRYWTPSEHKRFLEALHKFGAKDVRAIASFVGSRNATQVRTHAQKYFLRVAREAKAGSALQASKKRSMSESDLARVGRAVATPPGSPSSRDRLPEDSTSEKDAVDDITMSDNNHNTPSSHLFNSGTSGSVNANAKIQHTDILTSATQLAASQQQQQNQNHNHNHSQQADGSVSGLGMGMGMGMGTLRSSRAASTGTLSSLAKTPPMFSVKPASLPPFPTEGGTTTSTDSDGNGSLHPSFHHNHSHSHSLHQSVQPSQQRKDADTEQRERDIGRSTSSSQVSGSKPPVGNASGTADNAGINLLSLVATSESKIGAQSSP